MNGGELDAFFAKAEDVLDNWHGGADAMHGSPPDEGRDELAPPGSSYYEQTCGNTFAGNTFAGRALSVLADLNADNMRITLHTGMDHILPIIRGNVFVAPAGTPFTGEGWAEIGYTDQPWETQ